MKNNSEKWNLGTIKNEKLILIILAGIVLVVCTIWENSEKKQITEKNSEIPENSKKAEENYWDDYIKKQEKRLKDILEKLDGVGDVSVMITVKNTTKNEILMEKNISYEDSEDKYIYSEENKTVYLEDSEGNTRPYVMMESMPRPEGVAVITSGAKNPVVKQKIINIVKSLFGVEVNKISVTD